MRQCNNPKESCGGPECVGNETETTSCNEHLCEAMDAKIKFWSSVYRATLQGSQLSNFTANLGDIEGAGGQAIFLSGGFGTKINTEVLDIDGSTCSRNTANLRWV